MEARWWRGRILRGWGRLSPWPQRFENVTCGVLSQYTMPLAGDVGGAGEYVRFRQEMRWGARPTIDPVDCQQFYQCDYQMSIKRAEHDESDFDSHILLAGISWLRHQKEPTQLF
jgi:hypothetical protein